ncbi:MULTISPECIES: hypothetical protein [Rhizobium]|uniref:hypothetical protein n=1 Tax=Rhizobium TaxID=379 RepID=UPI0019585B63|nr:MULTISPECIES: hypothetical protein [Rhizobium]MBM7046974.1 hypothetical protein [Rhizobium lusitanum]
MASKQNIDDAAVGYMRDKRQYRNGRDLFERTTASAFRSISYYFCNWNFCRSKEFSNMEEIYMNTNSNKPNLDLRTTPYARRSSFGLSIAIFAVVAAAALAWNFWPYANSPYTSVKESRVPAAQRTTTQPPATSMSPATAPAQQ